MYGTHSYNHEFHCLGDRQAALTYMQHWHNCHMTAAVFLLWSCDPLWPPCWIIDCYTHKRHSSTSGSPPGPRPKAHAKHISWLIIFNHVPWLWGSNIKTPFAHILFPSIMVTSQTLGQQFFSGGSFNITKLTLFPHIWSRDRLIFTMGIPILV